MATQSPDLTYLLSYNSRAAITAVPAVTAPSRRREITAEAGHGLEILGHAIEYLVDEHALESFNQGDWTSNPKHPRMEAIELLMACNREVYFSCPIVPTFGQRVRSLLKLHSA